MGRSLAESGNTDVLVSKAASGDGNALAALISRYSDHLKRMVGLRLDRRLRERDRASDIVQEALIEARRRLSDCQRDPRMGFFLWLRSITADKLLNAHSAHLGTQKRDAAREISLYPRPKPEACSVSIAQQLLRQIASPTRAIAQAKAQLIHGQGQNTVISDLRKLREQRSSTSDRKNRNEARENDASLSIALSMVRGDVQAEDLADSQQTPPGENNFSISNLSQYIETRTSCLSDSQTEFVF